MSNSKRVKIEDCRRYLMGYRPSPLLCDFEILWLQVIEEIASLQVFHDDIYEVRILKHVVKTNNIGMLTHFKNLNFSFQKLHVFQGKVFFLNNFYSYVLARLFVWCSFHQTILAFSKRFFKVIEIMQVCISNSFFYFIYPLVSLLLSFEVINSTFVWKDKHKGPYNDTIILFFFSLTFNEYSC